MLYGVIYLSVYLGPELGLWRFSLFFPLFSWIFFGLLIPANSESWTFWVCGDLFVFFLLALLLFACCSDHSGQRARMKGCVLWLYIRARRTGIHTSAPLTAMYCFDFEYLVSLILMTLSAESTLGFPDQVDVDLVDR
jgi:hypothetical protein